MNSTSQSAFDLEDAVMPLLRDGAWWDTHSPYYRYAYQEADAYVLAMERLTAGEAQWTKVHGAAGFNDVFASDVPDDLIELHEAAYRHAISCHLFVCMALEGFINAYGVRRLGERFYQQNLERVGITEKLAILGVCCRQWTLAPDSEVRRDFRQLFDDRNRLVHPKTREMRWDRLEDALYGHPSEIALHETMARLERCIDFLCEADNDIHRDFYFRR
ncbi:hypothetical protein [Stenotrophomonas tuberculopleuritidis]|uniref:hypothetical protein n=1 Tax=Stenotrophomonas tuberculopleuritidis TaxID=3055079 RepID=UPI0026E583BE|nr:hypothetical protein [Stenotrophomonas sp. 704A1]